MRSDMQRVEFQNPEAFRKLNTKLSPGECKTLYSGIEIHNVGLFPIHITIRTPKTEMYEHMAEEFFVPKTIMPNVKVVKEYKPTVILGNVLNEGVTNA